MKRANIVRYAGIRGLRWTIFFTFLFAAPVFDADDLEGVRFNQIKTEIERSGFEVVRARKLEDAEIAVQTDAAIGRMVVDWGKKGLEGKTAALINLMRRRGLDYLHFRRPLDTWALVKIALPSCLSLASAFGCSDALILTCRNT